MNDFFALIIVLIILASIRFIWYFTDPRPFKTVLQWNLKPKILTQSFKDIAVAVIIIITTIYFPLLKSSFDTIINYIGLVIFCIGGIIALWAKFTLNKSWGPAEELHDIKRQNKLITTGPYKYSRNPMYVGFFLLHIGMFIAIRSYLLPLAFLPIIKFYKSAAKEEKLLGKYFGKNYMQYKSKTPRFL